MSYRKTISIMLTLAMLLASTAFAIASRKETASIFAHREKLTGAPSVRDAIAPVETAPVEVYPGQTKPNSDPVYQQLRQLADNPEAFGGNVATVNNLVLKRDAATFALSQGEIYFAASVEGRTTAAVFIGTGEMVLTPPTETEQKSLAIYTGNTKLAEQFSQLVLRFTDKTLEEIKQSPNASMKTGGPQVGRAREIYRDNQSLLRKQLRYNMELRTLGDIYSPQRPGFFTAFVGGRRFGKLIYEVDPQGIPEVAPEKVSLSSYGESDGGIWTSFYLMDEYRKGTANSNQDNRLFDITRHVIDGAIRGTQITATDTISLRALAAGTRVLPFDLYPSLRVSRVEDEQGNELSFIQEGKDEDADFALILPQPLETGKTYKFKVQYQGGDALRDTGGGNFILLPRSSWYPNSANSGAFGDRAIFDMTFRFPKGHLLVATGTPSGAETQDGEMTIGKWTSGNTELAVAGFNYGKFKKKELQDKDSGYLIEFYANKEVPDELRDLQLYIERLQSQGYVTGTTLNTISTESMADVAIADTRNAMGIYSAYFGKLPFARIAMTQQPAFNFGQAWPTLVFMPYTAFIEGSQRVQLFGVRGGTDNYWKYVGPHEVAHQWWGHIIGWTSYHDQWMSEGFAEFSTSLYVQFVRKDMNKFIEFWEDQRKSIIEGTALTKGRKPYTVGPVTQGYRLNGAKTGNVAQFLIYPKGAYILHMLRMMMFDNKTRDTQFREMMVDFVKTYYNKDVSTEDFKRIVEKHITPRMDLEKNGRMDWFFRQWVYGTEMPSYRLEYQINSGEKPTMTARITQSGVSDDFRMLIPIYADFGNGWTRLGVAPLVGNSSIDMKDVPLPQAPKRVAICALNDVLALSIENKKR